MLNRRAILAGFPGFSIASLVRSEQPPKVVGVLCLFPLREFELTRPVFQQAMLELGYVVGKDFVLVERLAEGKSERLPALAAELVNLRVDLILASPTIAARAAQRATSTIPIVFERVADPVGTGLADSVAHPGRNLTGVSNFTFDLEGKQFQFLMEMVPGLKRVAILTNFGNPGFATLNSRTQSAGHQLGLSIQLVNARTVDELDGAFQAMVRERAEAVSFLADALLWPARQRVAELALQNRLPSMGPFEEYVQVGGLMSYGVDQSAGTRLTATYVDKIFRGAKPGELPIDQPTHLDLVINRKTAEALRLSVPQILLLQANKVVD
jgi:putative tryptophan/tyrosine transport system substrate-binding protein